MIDVTEAFQDELENWVVKRPVYEKVKGRQELIQTDEYPLIAAIYPASEKTLKQLPDSFNIEKVIEIYFQIGSFEPQMKDEIEYVMDDYIINKVNRNIHGNFFQLIGTKK